MKKQISWEKKRELEDRTIEALLLGFRKPLHLEYQIPSSHRVALATIYAVQSLCGFDYASAGCGDEICLGWKWVANPEKLGKRVREGIQFVLERADRESNSSLDLYMLCHPSKLAREWFSMKGDLHRFRRGERKKAEERVKAYWKSEELQDFRNLHKYMRDYTQKQLNV